MAAAPAVAHARRSRVRAIPYAGAVALAGPDFEAAGPDFEAAEPRGSTVSHAILFSHYEHKCKQPDS